MTAAGGAGRKLPAHRPLRSRASLLLPGLLIENKSSTYTDAVAERLKTSRAIAAPLLRLEVTNPSTSM